MSGETGQLPSLCYGMPGTDIVCAVCISLRACYAMPAAYAMLCDARYLQNARSQYQPTRFDTAYRRLA
eukprot:1573508-Rhodomonas_salina.1